jgi:hypothetical protein
MAARAAFVSTFLSSKEPIFIKSTNFNFWEKSNVKFTHPSSTKNNKNY